MLPDDDLINKNLINKVEDESNNIITPNPADNLNSNINEENDSTNNELTTNTNKNLMTGDTSNISKTIQIQNQNLSRKNNLYNKIGSGLNCPSELELEPESKLEEV